MILHIESLRRLPFLECQSLICDMDQEVFAFHGNTATLKKLCLPPVQENRIHCNQDKK